MIGSIEKGITAAKVQTPPAGVYEGVDLRVLPQYICYKSALLKEKWALKQIVIVLLVLLGTHYVANRLEIKGLYNKLREKEYILAPGVQSFTKVSPQSVPDDYVEDAVESFIGLLNTFDSRNIEKNYKQLTKYMSPSFKIRFEIETDDWIRQVRENSISQISTIEEKEIVTDEQGNYLLKALVRSELYSEKDYVGFEDKIVTMNLSLTSPQDGQRWYLQINELKDRKAKKFNDRRKLIKKLKNNRRNK